MMDSASTGLNWDWGHDVDPSEPLIPRDEPDDDSEQSSRSPDPPILSSRSLPVKQKALSFPPDPIPRSKSHVDISSATSIKSIPGNWRLASEHHRQDLSSQSVTKSDDDLSDQSIGLSGLEGQETSGARPTSPKPKPVLIIEKVEESLDGTAALTHEDDDDDEHLDDEPYDEERQVSMIAAIKAALVCIIAVTTASFWSFAMTSSPAPTVIVYVAGSIGVAMAPLVCYREVLIAKVSKARKTIAWLRQKANKFMEGNKNHLIEVEALQGKVEHSKRTQALDTLIKIAAAQDEDVNSLVKMVKENTSMLDEMRRLQRAMALADIIHIALIFDKENDLGDEELDHLALKLHHRLRLRAHGVHMNVPSFKRTVCESDNRSLDGMLRICIDAMLFHSEEFKELPSDYSGEFDFDPQEEGIFMCECPTVAYRGKVHVLEGYSQPLLFKLGMGRRCSF